MEFFGIGTCENLTLIYSTFSDSLIVFLPVATVESVHQGPIALITWVGDRCRYGMRNKQRWDIFLLFLIASIELLYQIDFWCYNNVRILCWFIKFLIVEIIYFLQLANNPSVTRSLIVNDKVLALTARAKLLFTIETVFVPYSFHGLHRDLWCS